MIYRMRNGRGRLSKVESKIPERKLYELIITEAANNGYLISIGKRALGSGSVQQH